MMSKKTKSLLYNFLGFGIIYIPVYFLIREFTELAGFWIPLTAAVVASILAPKFQTVKTNAGEKIYIISLLSF
jgi:hypothetical protein